MAPSVVEAMEAGFVPALDKDQAYVYPVGVAPVLTRSAWTTGY